jgi:hypothetical protein
MEPLAVRAELQRGAGGEGVEQAGDVVAALLGVGGELGVQHRPRRFVEVAEGGADLGGGADVELAAGAGELTHGGDGPARTLLQPEEGSLVDAHFPQELAGQGATEGALPLGPGDGRCVVGLGVEGLLPGIEHLCGVGEAVGH